MTTTPSLFSLLLVQLAATPEPQHQASPLPDWLILSFVVVVGCVLLLVILLGRREKHEDESGGRARTTSSAPPKTEPERAAPPGDQLRNAPPGRPSPPQPAEATQPATAIFINYRREDSSDVAGRIYDRLCQHFGKEAVFKDVDSIPLGIDFRKHLSESVGQCNVVLAIIGRQWLAGDRSQRRLEDARDFVRIEIEAALKRDIPVVPVLVQGASMPSPDDLPEILHALVYRNGIPVRSDPDFHQDMDRLIKGIERYLKSHG